MKVLFRVESRDKVLSTFKNKVARIQSDELDKFAWFMFNNRDRSLNKIEIAELHNIDEYQVAKLIARLNQAYFMFNKTGTKPCVSYQMIGIDQKVKCTIKGLVTPDLNPLIEAVFC